MQDHVELQFEGSKAAAELWLAFEVGQTMKAILPRMVASLCGWRRLEAGFTRPPLPCGIMTSIVLRFAMRRQRQAGRLIWMVFEAYL